MRAWDEKGHRMTLIETEKADPAERFFIPSSVEIVAFPPLRQDRLKRVITHCRLLIGLLKERKDAVLLSFLPQSNIKCAIVSLFVPNKIILSEINDPRYSPRDPFLRLSRPLVYRMADHVVFLTEEIKAMFPHANGTVITNPVSPTIPLPGRRKKEKIVISAGRLTRQKDMGLLIRAFARFSKEHPEYLLHIYGQGPQKEMLQDMIEGLDLKDKAFLFPFASDIYAKMDEASIYVSSSEWEGVSLSIIEAMALGLPVIATDTPAGGTKVLMKDHYDGLVIPCGDEDALYGALKEFAEDEGLAESCAANALKIRERYPLEKIAEEWLELM